MSELKAGVIVTPHNEGMSFSRDSVHVSVTEGETEFYLKSEVDTAIAELKQEKEYVLENTTDALNAQERELRLHKYKRCLRIAENCSNKGRYYYATYRMGKAQRMCEWCERWLDIARHFKEAK